METHYVYATVIYLLIGVVVYLIIFRNALKDFYLEDIIPSFLFTITLFPIWLIFLSCMHFHDKRMMRKLR
jgi:hypothetical protein